MMTMCGDYVGSIWDISDIVELGNKLEWTQFKEEFIDKFSKYQTQRVTGSVKGIRSPGNGYHVFSATLSSKNHGRTTSTSYSGSGYFAFYSLFLNLRTSNYSEPLTMNQNCIQTKPTLTDNFHVLYVTRRKSEIFMFILNDFWIVVNP